MKPPPEWPQMPTRLMSMNGVARGELLDRRLLVGQAVVAQVAVAVVVVPLRPLRVAAAVADLDDDEPELRERDVVAARVEGLGHALGLRPGIDVGDDRILPRRVEVERLVHHAVEIGDAVVGLDRERLGELEAGVHQRRQVGRLELHHHVAQRVVEHRLRRAVDARRVVDEVTAPSRRSTTRVRGVAGVEQLEPGAVEADAVEVRVVRVLALLAAGGGEVERRASSRRRCRCRSATNSPSVIRFFSAPVFGVVEVEVPPAVALGPEHQLRAVVRRGAAASISM